MGSRSKVGSFARGVAPFKGGGAVLGMWTGGVAWTTRTGAVLGLGKPAVGPATSGTCVFVTRQRRDVRTRGTASMARTLRTRQTCGGQRRRRRRRPSFFRRRRLINGIQPRLVLGDQPLDPQYFGRREDVPHTLDVVQRRYCFGLLRHRRKRLEAAVDVVPARLGRVAVAHGRRSLAQAVLALDQRLSTIFIGTLGPSVSRYFRHISVVAHMTRQAATDPS